MKIHRQNQNLNKMDKNVVFGRFVTVTEVILITTLWSNFSKDQHFGEKTAKIVRHRKLYFRYACFDSALFGKKCPTKFFFQDHRRTLTIPL